LLSHSLSPRRPHLCPEGRVRQRSRRPPPCASSPGSGCT